MPITNLPNPGMDFTPLTPLTAEQMDDIVENIEAINNATIQTGSIADGAITKAKLGADAMSNQNYSTSEIDTGTTWIDGKKIYKKTFVKTLSSPSVESSYSTALGITNISEVVKFEASHKRIGAYSDIMSLPYYKGSAYYDFYVDLNENSLEVNWNLSGTGLTGTSYSDIITIYYTKTS